MALPSTCPDCGQKIRPCNMTRHRRARHIPKKTRTVYGAEFSVPTQPIRLGKNKDRRYDDVAPRGEGTHRYRIYRLRAGELELISTAPTPEKFGVALARLHERGAFVGDDAAGVLDTITDPGHWVINPWTLGRRPTE
jgi:hypothetical protein